MAIQTLNPATGLVVKTFPELSEDELQAKIRLASQALVTWRKSSFEERAQVLKKVAQDLRTRASELAGLITLEMGRPITPAKAEIEKCAWVCEYYAEQGQRLLEPELIATDAQQSGVRFDPLGVVLAVMPWNFPFWQVMRFAAPALMAGNVGLLKHASSVPQCALALEQLFERAGAAAGVFQTLLISASRIESLAEDERIAAATLTGSERAGMSLGAACGKNIKPVVLELGGSDPYLVLQDANVELAAQTAVTARFQNAGQSCIAAKRFIVEQAVAPEFTQKVTELASRLVVGDPEKAETQMGPLCSEQGIQDMERQLAVSVSQGAAVATGGQRINDPGFFFQPTVVTNVSSDMPVWTEETFGPVMPVMVVDSVERAIQVANNSRFGLAATIWSQDSTVVDQCVRELQAGAVFVNGMVKSDPRLPFGGIKKSGIGRELGEYGIKSFVNVKTFWIHQG